MNPDALMSPYVYVPKGWGYEQWICNFEKYCGKILVFYANKKCSVHYHNIKDEVMFVDSGEITMRYGWSDNDLQTIVLSKGMSFHVQVGLRHQMIAGADGAKLIEFSTHHEDSDSIRIEKGD